MATCRFSFRERVECLHHFLFKSVYDIDTDIAFAVRGVVVSSSRGR